MKPSFQRPYAITMWDFSWLERRWPGAGYEDWDVALDELAERVYNAVRIDAFPHLVSADPGKEWEIIPTWNQTSWGAQSLTRIRVMPALIEFIAKCRDRNIGVARYDERHLMVVDTGGFEADEREELARAVRTQAEAVRDAVSRTIAHAAERDAVDARAARLLQALDVARGG